MKKLTEKQANDLKACKGIIDGSGKFFDILKEIYATDEETLTEINKCREMFESVDTVEFYSAHEKTQHMYYQYMDDLLNKIGYYA